MRSRTLNLLIALALILVSFLTLYAMVLFSDIPFIKKWRTIYIETAMSTMSHQWLATEFIPQPIIDEVMAGRENIIAAQTNLESDWSSDSEVKTITVSGEDDFFSTFDEIDKESFDEYITEHPEAKENGYSKLLIDESGLNQKGTTINTKEGDQVLAIDAANGILIVKVSGSGYCGKLAIIKDPSKVKIAPASQLGVVGETVKDISAKSNAVLAVNASGFSDIGGIGNGGEVVGLLVSNGILFRETANNGYLTIGFGTDDRLYVGHLKETSLFRDAIEFFPAEVVNGKNVTDGSTGFGVQPRTSIGQSEDGDVFFLTIDGRQIGYSIGCTVGDCAEIMLRYDAAQACNVDGGSSTVMVYRGNEITKPANGSKAGRYVPDAFIVEYTAK